MSTCLRKQLNNMIPICVVYDYLEHAARTSKTRAVAEDIDAVSRLQALSLIEDRNLRISSWVTP